MLQIGFDIIFTSLCGLMLIAAYRNIFHQKGSDFAPASAEPVPAPEKTPVYPNRVSLNEVIQAEMEGMYQSLCREWDDHYLTAQRGMLVVAGKVSSGTVGIVRPPLSTVTAGYSQFIGRTPVESDAEPLFDSITLSRDRAQNGGWYLYAIPHHMSSVFGKHRKESGWIPFVDRHIAHLRSGYFALIPSHFLASLDPKAAHQLTDLSMRIYQAGEDQALRTELIEEYRELLKAILAEQPDPHIEGGGMALQKFASPVYP